MLIPAIEKYYLSKFPAARAQELIALSRSNDRKPAGRARLAAATRAPAMDPRTAATRTALSKVVFHEGLRGPAADARVSVLLSNWQAAQAKKKVRK